MIGAPVKVLLVVLISCSVVFLPASASVGASAGASAGVRWKPAPGTTWQWQLSSQVGTPLKVDAYDVDGFDTKKRAVKRLERNGSRTICYLSAGSWERWRPDRGRFPKAVLGRNYDGWPGEKWLDVRKIGKLAPVMRSRMEMCRKKGFDAVEPDNIDGYTNRTGFRITYEDQLRYNRWLAREAHKRGLSIALKNDPAQAKDLAGVYDFAITEDCFDEGWCRRMSPFAKRNKAVLSAEYTDTGARTKEFCPRAKRLGFDAILKKRDLGVFRRGC